MACVPSFSDSLHDKKKTEEAGDYSMHDLSQQPTTIDLVRHFRERRALVIGDALLDSYLEGKHHA